MLNKVSMDKVNMRINGVKNFNVDEVKMVLFGALRF
jgi:hypothetical protein